MGHEEPAKTNTEERESKREKKQALRETPAQAGGCARGSLLFAMVLRSSLPIRRWLTAAAVASLNARQHGFFSPECRRLHCLCSKSKYSGWRGAGEELMWSKRENHATVSLRADRSRRRELGTALIG